jgi:hypothetical protein
MVSVRITPAWPSSASTATSACRPGRRCASSPRARPPRCARSSPPRWASCARPGGRPREAARVAEVLQVQQDHLGRRVVLPVLHEVVRRRRPCCRCSRTARCPCPAPPRDRGWPGPARPTATRSATLPEGREVGAKVASRRTAGSALSTPRQLGPTMRMPQRRSLATARLQRLPRPADLREARADHHHPPHALAPAAPPRSGTCAAGTTSTARSTSSGMSRRCAYARTDCTTAARRVHRVDRALEAEVHEVVEHLRGDGAPLAGGADDGDGAGAEQGVEVTGGGGRLTPRR